MILPFHYGDKRQGGDREGKLPSTLNFSKNLILTSSPYMLMIFQAWENAYIRGGPRQEADSNTVSRITHLFFFLCNNGPLLHNYLYIPCVRDCTLYFYSCPLPLDYSYVCNNDPSHPDIVWDLMINWLAGMSGSLVHFIAVWKHSKCFFTVFCKGENEMMCLKIF